MSVLKHRVICLTTDDHDAVDSVHFQGERPMGHCPIHLGVAEHALRMCPRVPWSLHYRTFTVTRSFSTAAFTLCTVEMPLFVILAVFRTE